MAITVRDGADPDTATITFTLTVDDVVGPVSVVGSFNGWQAGADPFSEPDDDGVLVAQVVVAAGSPIHFRYLAEGDVWLDDGDADVITEHGSILLLGSGAEVTMPRQRL